MKDVSIARKEKKMSLAGTALLSWLFRDGEFQCVCYSHSTFSFRKLRVCVCVYIGV